MFALPFLFVALSADPTAWKTGPELTRELTSPLNAQYARVPLLEAAESLSSAKRVAVWIDPSVDPSQPVEASFVETPLLEALRTLARQANADVVSLHSLVVIAPEESARRLRTLVALVDESLAADKEFAKRVLARKSLAWDDLATPAEIVTTIGDGTHWSLAIEGIDEIPHDHWRPGKLPDVTAAEALTFILLSSDRTVRVNPKTGQLQVVRLPDDVTLTRDHRLPPRDADRRLSDWQQTWPEARIVSKKGQTVTVAGLVEAHEALDITLAGRPTPRATTPTGSGEKSPLAMRRFTLKIAGAPLSAVLAELGKSGIEFQYDMKALEQAGIDLSRRVTVMAERLTAEEFFRELFKDSGIEFAVEGNMVRLVPAEK
jgi:hypothetical protein